MVEGDTNGHRVRGRAMARVVVTLTVLAVGAACTSDTDSEPTTDITRDPILPTIATVPPATIAHTTPTTLRPLAVDRGVLHNLYPFSPTEVLSIGHTPQPDGRKTARFWAIDVVTGSTTALASPPINVRNYTGSDTFGATDGTIYYGAATCDDPQGECAAPTVEVWRLDGTTRTWELIGSYTPGELVGQPWDGRDIQVGPIGIEDGRVHLGVFDDGDYAENRGSHDIVIDPETGDLERETPKRTVYPDDRGCRTSSGLQSRIVHPDRFVQIRRSPADDWQAVPNSAPASDITCGATSVWALTDVRWINLDADGHELSSQVLPGHRDAASDIDLTYTEYSVVGGDTDHVGLVGQQGRDLIADLSLRTTEVEIVVLADPTQQPLVHVVANPVDLAGNMPGAFTEGAHSLPPFALQLPGGRLVILSPDPSAPLLIAE